LVILADPSPRRLIHRAELKGFDPKLDFNALNLLNTTI